MPLRPLLRPLLLPLGAAAMLASGCDTLVWGNGDAASEERSLATFSAIDLSAAIDVELEVVGDDGVAEREPGRSSLATLRCDSNLIGRIETVVEGETLRVRPTDDDIDLRPRGACELVLATERLELVSITGPGTLVAEGITADVLDVRVEGPGELVLTGSVDRLHASLEGPVELDAENLGAREVELDAEGPVEASVRASERCVLDLEGPVEIDVLGDPDTRDVDIDGPAEVHFR